MKNSQSNNTMGIFNVLVIIYNFINVIINCANGFVSYSSLIILGINLFITIRSLKVNGKTTSETICLIIEIITALIIVSGIF